MYLTLEVSI